MINAINKL